MLSLGLASQAKPHSESEGGLLPAAWGRFFSSPVPLGHFFSGAASGAPWVLTGFPVGELRVLVALSTRKERGRLGRLRPGQGTSRGLRVQRAYCGLEGLDWVALRCGASQDGLDGPITSGRAPEGGGLASVDAVDALEDADAPCRVQGGKASGQDATGQRDDQVAASPGTEISPYRRRETPLVPRPAFACLWMLLTQFVLRRKISSRCPLLKTARANVSRARAIWFCFFAVVVFLCHCKTATRFVSAVAVVFASFDFLTDVLYLAFAGADQVCARYRRC